MKLTKKIDKKFVKFLFVGALNTLVGYLLYAIFVSTPLPQWVALFCAYVFGVLWNFKTTGTLVFKNKNNGLIFKFIGAYVFTFFVNLLFLKALMHLGLGKYVAQLILVLPIAVLSFILFKYLVFKEAGAPKIIIKMGGGLGNQMFEYATAQTLAKKLNCGLEFDLSYFNHGYARPNELGIFGVVPKKTKDFRAQLYWFLRKPLKYLKCEKFLGLNIYNEKTFIYEKRFEQIQPNTFVSGFFQSIKYFDAELAREIFSFIAQPEGENKELSEKMNLENSVSIHIRRGDYLKSHHINFYNQLGQEYYTAAIEKIKEHTLNPQFYVFSDDVNWVEENLKLDNATYVKHNTGVNSWRDLMLMCRCKHNIIANSSFSFWGAFLNQNPQKMVIAPKIWFSGDDADKKTTDLFPKDWILV